MISLPSLRRHDSTAPRSPRAGRRTAGLSARFGRSTLSTLTLATVLAGLCVLGAPAPAEAQQSGSKKGPEKLEPPTPPPPREGGANYAAMGIAVLLVGAIIGVNVIPSKRGHQD